MSRFRYWLVRRLLPDGWGVVDLRESSNRCSDRVLPESPLERLEALGWGADLRDASNQDSKPQ